MVQGGRQGSRLDAAEKVVRVVRFVASRLLGFWGVHGCARQERKPVNFKALKLAVEGQAVGFSGVEASGARGQQC